MGKKPGIRKVARMSRIIRQLQRDQKQSDPVFTTISRPLSKLPGRHPRELNFTERMCRSWMIGGWWWWRGRGWLGDTKMEWRDHGGWFRRDEKWNYTRVEIMNDARIFHVYSSSKFVWNAIREDTCSPVLSYRKTESPISKWKLTKVEKPVNERTRRAN